MVWESPNSGREPFNRQMRKKTREIHSVSDALVNAKLVLTLGDSTVWADGLLAFYEIFKFLEEVTAHTHSHALSEMMLKGLLRTKAFEKDLAFYLGKNWADKYSPRQEVLTYLQHLRQIERTNPDMLIAYIYHLYMGLLSGGQILRKKRMLTKSLWFWSQKNDKDGYAVTEFGSQSLYSLKMEMIDTLNKVVKGLSEKTRAEILDESCNVFKLNNLLISSLPSGRNVLIKKLLTYFLLFFMMFIIAKYILNF